MAQSIITNWGKAFLSSAAFQNLDPDGAALPSTLYIILVDSTFTGWTGTSDPDLENISSITGRVNPSGNYTGNSVARSALGFTVTKDTTNDRGVVTFTTAPIITAAANLTNIQGYALCTANSSTTAKIITLQKFDAIYSLTASQTGTITAASMLVT